MVHRLLRVIFVVISIPVCFLATSTWVALSFTSIAIWCSSPVFWSTSTLSTTNLLLLLVSWALGISLCGSFHLCVIIRHTLPLSLVLVLFLVIRVVDIVSPLLLLTSRTSSSYNTIISSLLLTISFNAILNILKPLSFNMLLVLKVLSF